MLIPSGIVLIKPHSEIALSLVDGGGRATLILVIIVIFVVILIVVLGLWNRLSIVGLIKDWTIGLNIFSWDHWKGTDWTICRAPLETLASHVEILKLQLLYASFKHPIGLPQLNQLSVNSINSEIVPLSWSVRAQLCIHVELSILSVGLSKNALDLIRDHVFIVLSIVLQDTLNQFKSFSECLVFDVESENLRIRVLLLPPHLFNGVSELSIGFK